MTSSLVFVSQRSFESYHSQTALPVKKKKKILEELAHCSLN